MSNLTLLHPWLLALLPLPLLAWWLLPPHRATKRGLVVPFLPRSFVRQRIVESALPLR